MVKRFRVIILGKVQGVFFRASACEQAKALGLRGFVRNLSDGSVELEAQGESDRLNDLLRWCRHGPPGARVDEVNVEWKTPEKKETDFLTIH